jgi:crotonobetainyl-CoA:carnitine CoA-transferase CaiB-like acyl-CoA transferase
LADSPENILSRYEPQTTWSARVKARISELDECVEPILSVQEAAKHPQLKERNMVNQTMTQDNQIIPQISSPLCSTNYWSCR